ncbi:VTT domain-containing protein [Erythrobacter sp. EC-HK427]|uniref:VTT domain-containing protein n=1 Tax=Erythrobacter sp. EC-HK427 TaxID=2038396 RepID=UPI001255CFF3|nr:VTT domain-containing protein [Erythrobacter sp. EC-HK427]VVT06100.1 Dihydrolipoamide dehydrogenase [Erythrobacter sp. EC-HK427]
MDYAAPSWLPLGFVEALAASPYGAFAAPAMIALLAFGSIFFSIPGTLTPTAFVSGLLLGMGGLLIVVGAAALGSHLLFLITRRWLGERMQRKFGARLDQMADHLHKRGPFYVATARLGGVPHLLITAGAAPTPITAQMFALASFVGMLPILTLAALAGSGVALL